MTERKRILIVDDDPAIRRSLVTFVAELGYEAQTALDGEHALRSAMALHPDVILLDIHLPEAKYALAFATRYRDRVPADSRAPLIAMSGSAELGTLGQQLGAMETLAKPFDLALLEKLLWKYLGDPVSAAASETHSVEDVPQPAEVPPPLAEPSPLPETGPA